MEDIYKTQGLIGTENNPILLEKRLSDRRLLKEHMPSVESADLARYAKASIKNAQHVMNLISTPTLDIDELKVALFLFEHWVNQENWIDQQVFSIKNQFKTDNFGSNGGIYFSQSSSGLHPQQFKKPKYNLLQLLNKQNISLKKNCDLLKILTKLHDFALLTLTQVNINFCLNKSLPAPNSITTEYVHIVLNIGVVNSKLNLKWGKPKRTTVKHKEEQSPSPKLGEKSEVSKLMKQLKNTNKK
ncbi:hypothetical protein [Shewanella sp. TB7-MNA-CIBAN-0143]|uniref:hypothetical protein n=1 Tax=unclassified Shewanella TaxID=196818 RepID=UPI00331E1792